VKKFIESVTQTKDEDNPKLIKLRQSVDSQWFIDHWNAKHPVEVQSRPGPPTYPPPNNPKDESINDLVFEALGSKTNAKDFVLCESGINSAKGKLWSNKNPHYGTNAVFFYLETVLFLCFKHRAVFF
jgi:hypothetical protein